MAAMGKSDYHREVRMFRGELTNTAAPGGRRTLKAPGFQWYSVKAEPGLRLYLDLTNLYLKGFRNAAQCYKFYGLADPASRGGAIINAVELAFLESYNSNGQRQGIGLPQDQPCTVTLQNLNDALTTMANGAFAAKAVDEQRLAVARCVVGIIEAARFVDVEEKIVDGTPITDRSWVHHVNQAKLFIDPP